MSTEPRINVTVEKDIKPDLDVASNLSDQLKKVVAETEQRAKGVEKQVSKKQIPDLFSQDSLAVTCSIIFHAIGKSRGCPNHWDLDNEEANASGHALARWANERLGPNVGRVAPELELISVFGVLLIGKLGDEPQPKKPFEPKYDVEPIEQVESEVLENDMYDGE